MRFGIQTGQQHRSYDDLLALWRLADDLGYETAWLYDHLIPVGGDRGGPVFEAWTLLSSLLSRTERIRGGILVSCVMYRHPAVLAKEAVTVDHASGGRLEFGIGSCWNAWEAGEYGIGFPGHPDRHARLLEAIGTIRALWAGEGAPAGPRPVQQPHPPVWVGGTGARVGEAAALADGWNVIFTTIEEYRAHRERVRRAVADAGRDPDTLRLSFGQRVVVDRDPDRALQVARQMYERNGVPFDDHLRDRVITGDPATVAERIAAFGDLGVEQFILWHEPPFDAEAAEQLAAVAETVVPLLA